MVFGEHIMTQSEMFKWDNRFKYGSESEEDPHRKWLTISCNEENVRKVVCYDPSPGGVDNHKEHKNFSLFVGTQSSVKV
jgi:hypothetical protein